MTFKAISFSIFSFSLIAHTAGAHVSVTYPQGGEKFSPGNTIAIQWKEIIDHGENNWDIYFSQDGGKVWEELAIDIDESKTEYMWDIPVAMTSQALVKVIQDNTSDTDYEALSREFTISTEIPGGGEGHVITALGKDMTFSDEMELYNFPNPFDDYTAIQFYLPESGHVHLSVFNIQGNLVYDVPENMLNAGIHKLLWENRDLPNGLYVCNLVADEQSISAKMILRR